MAFLPLRPIGSPLPAPPPFAARNADREATLARAGAEVRAGWGETAAARVREKGKLPTWERLERLVDPGTEILPVGSYVNWGRDFRGSKRQAPGAGVVTAWCTVEGRRVIV